MSTTHHNPSRPDPRQLSSNWRPLLPALLLLASLALVVAVYTTIRPYLL